MKKLVSEINSCSVPLCMSLSHVLWQLTSILVEFYRARNCRYTDLLFLLILINFFSSIADPSVVLGNLGLGYPSMQRSKKLALICQCVAARCIAAMHANQTSQHAATQLAVLKTWQVSLLTAAMFRHSIQPNILKTPQNSEASMTRIMCRTLRRRYESRRFSLVSEEQLGRRESVQCHSCCQYKRDDQEGAQGARYQCLSQDDLNDEEAADTEVEAAKVPVKDQIAKPETPILES